MRIVGEAKVIRTFRCRDCGCGATGTTRRVSFDVCVPEDVGREIDRELKSSNRDFPVGWAGRCGGGFTCNDCTHKEL